MLDPLEAIIRDSLLDFAREVARSGWRGREREAVSLFAFRFLLPQCRQGTPLFDPAQIGLEVAVPQLPGPGRKPQVCKDLVIWPEPAMVCWDGDGRPVHQPAAILEWKTRTKKVSLSDEAWLCEYSALASGFIGFAIALDPQDLETSLVASRAMEGVLTREWVRYSGCGPTA